MNRKTLSIIIIALLLVAFVALLWWWFLGRVNQSLPSTGGFGTTTDKTLSGLLGKPRTNVSLPTVEGLGTLPSGTYVLKRPDGTSLGSFTLQQLAPQTGLGGAPTYTSTQKPIPPGTYAVYNPTGALVGGYTVVATPGTIGSYTINPIPPIAPGQYKLSAPQANGTSTPIGIFALGPGVVPNAPPGVYIVEPQGGGPSLGTIVIDTSAAAYLGNPNPTPNPQPGIVATSTPYLGDINTPNVSWYFQSTSTVAFGPTTNTGGPPLDYSPGTIFNPTDINQIAGSNPSGGILPNFDASLNGGSGNGDIDLTRALVGAGIGALVGCGANLGLTAASGAIGGTLGLTSGVAGAGATVAGAGVTGGGAALSAAFSASPAAGSAVTGALAGAGGTAAGISPVAGMSAAEFSGDVLLQGGNALGVSSGAAGGTTAAGTGVSTSGGGSAAGLASVLVIDIPLVIGQIFQGLTLSGILTANTTNTGLHVKDETDTFLGCVARTAAREALRQITTSVVNWINSGFKGSPSFVTNPTQFFTNVADVAAGQFIKGSALSFLCDPFRINIRIAITYSYQHQNDRQCTLTGIANNVKNFVNGSFSAGGWPTFLSFTMSPTNNPFGAYAYGVNGLNSSIANAQGSFQVQLNQGRGFLSLQQQQNCKNYSGGNLPPGVSTNQTVTQITGGSTGVIGAGGKVTQGGVVINAGFGAQKNQSVSLVSDTGQQGPTQSGGTVGATYEVCDLVTTTPGSVIAGSIDKTLGVGQDSLNMAKNFDEIISALITQLMTNVLQLGLTNVSGNNGTDNSAYYTPDQQAAQAAGQDLIAKMKVESQNYNQLGTIKQSEIGDIQAAQSKLNDLANCWKAAVKKAQAAIDALQVPENQYTTNSFEAHSFNPNVVLVLTPEMVAFNAASTTAHQNLATAQARVQAATDAIAAYETKVATLNQQITDINSAITLLEQYQSRALSANSMSDASQLSTEYGGAQVHLTQTDLTTEQQNRTSLQTALASLSTNITTSFNQCHAF